MITNLIVIVFILLTVFWFSTQGLLSAFLHLIVLLCAGSLALAAWEPLTLNYLIERMPEYAWGVGLLAPFALFVLIGRIVIDLLVPGNMNFHPLANSIAGGALGFVSAMLTAGIVLIGAQFIGGFSIGGYQPYTLESGQLKRTDHLWLGADDFADAVFTALSNNAFFPYNANPLGKVQPSLVEAAGAFQLPAREYGRMSIQPANVSVSRQFTLDIKQLPKEVQATGSGSLIAVTTQINLAGSGKGSGAADSDGIFTASAAQVTLIVADEQGVSQVIPASGYVIGDSFGTLAVTGEYARTKPVGDATIDWLFAVPVNANPAYLRIKQVRIPLADIKSIPQPQVVDWMSKVEWIPSPIAANTNPVSNNGSDNVGAQHGVGTGLEGIEIRVDDTLPVTLSDNWLSSRANNVDTRNHMLVSAEGSIQILRNERVERNLAITQIYHPDNLAIVRLKMDVVRARSMYGKAMQFAGSVVLAPVLVSDSGDDYYAVGYCRYDPAGKIYLNVDTNSMIRAMTQIDVNRMADGEELYLYFRTARGIHLKEFKVGQASTQNINVPVP